MLILIVTKDCNLRCKYCGVKKKRSYMTIKIAQKAILIYLRAPEKQKKMKIRFFGGEPLLRWSLIKDIIVFAEKESLKRKLNINFDLTTNGLLLDSEKIKYFHKNNKVELIISLDGDSSSQNMNRNFFGRSDSYKNIYKLRRELSALPNATVNMVIAPNQARKFYKNFTHIYDLGFKRFNFLPAYFVFWSNINLKYLKNGFDEILFFIRKNKNISIKNQEIFSKVPFFNQGFVVDCDGSVYGLNIILLNYFERFSRDLKIGNAMDDNFKFSTKKNTKNKYLDFINNNIDKELFRSSIMVDKILTNFVNKLAV